MMVPDTTSLAVPPRQCQAKTRRYGRLGSYGLGSCSTYSRLVPATSMLVLPLWSDVAVPQPALGVAVVPPSGVEDVLPPVLPPTVPALAPVVPPFPLVPRPVLPVEAPVVPRPVVLEEAPVVPRPVVLEEAPVVPRPVLPVEAPVVLLVALASLLPPDVVSTDELV